MIADRIKSLREASQLTQSELAKKLDITRSSVNAWEMGISVPSTIYLIELSKLFHVSTDYILDLSSNDMLDISSLTEDERAIIYKLLMYFQAHKGS